MTTPEEMVETYWTAWNKSGDLDPVVREDDVFVCIRAGILAVIEKHVRPTITAAVIEARDGCTVPFEADGANEIAARIIAQLTKQNEPAKHEA